MVAAAMAARVITPREVAEALVATAVMAAQATHAAEAVGAGASDSHCSGGHSRRRGVASTHTSSPVAPLRRRLALPSPLWRSSRRISRAQPACRCFLARGCSGLLRRAVVRTVSEVGTRRGRLFGGRLVCFLTLWFLSTQDLLSAGRSGGRPGLPTARTLPA